MKKILMTTVLTTALFLGATTAQAECPCQHKDKKMPPPPPRFEKMHKKQFTPEQKAKMEQRKAEMDKRLGITEEQKAQLKAIHEQSKEQIAPKVKALTEAEFELKVLKQREYNQNKYGIATLEEVQLSGKTIPQLEAEVKTLKNEIREIKKTNFEKSQKVFTEEQKAELKKMRDEKHKKHHHKKHWAKYQKPMPKDAPTE